MIPKIIEDLSEVSAHLKKDGNVVGCAPALRERIQTRVDAVEFCKNLLLAMEELRAEEGAHFTVACDNPEFNELPDCMIEAVGSFTAWKPLNFTGQTLLECFDAAVKAKREFESLPIQKTHGDEIRNPS